MSEKRDVVFYVADGTMEAVFQKFLGKGAFEGRLGCKSFSYDIARDPRSTDGGLHRRAHLLLEGYKNTHEKVVVVLDQQFGGELPAEQVRQDIEANLEKSGWATGSYAVIVIDPELEVWLWQDNGHVEHAVGYKGQKRLREHLADIGEWPNDQAKPSDPKASIQKLIKSNRAGPPMVVYSNIASNVSAKRCVDGAFQSMVDQLGGWFPKEHACK